MERFRFLFDENDDWYLIPEDRVYEFGAAVNHFRSKSNLGLFYESFGKYKLGNSIESYSFKEPEWEG